MRIAVGQCELKRAVFFILHQSARARKCHSRFVRLGHVGQHDSLPGQSLRRDVLYVKDEVRQALIEHSRFDFQRYLSDGHLIFQIAEMSRRPGRDPDVESRVSRPRRNSQEQHREEQAVHRNTRGTERDGLRIGRHSAESCQKAYQQRHRNGKS